VFDRSRLRAVGTAIAKPATLSVASLLVLVGCLPVTGGTSGPTVQSLSPASRATGVAITTTVSATFNEAIESGLGALSLTGAGAVTGNDGWSGSTITFTPSVPLANATSYTATVSGVRDSAGNVGAPVTWSFTTAALVSPPSAPTAVTASAGNAGATLFWSAPSDGGSPITSYTITPFIGNTAQPTTTVSGSPPPASSPVYGLTNGATYTFAITATNAAGSGPPSSPSNSIQPLSSALTLPDLEIRVPTSTFSIANSGGVKLLQYTHQTENAGTGPFELRPSYNSATGISAFSQAVYTSSSPGVWQFAQSVSLPHNGVWNPPSDYLWPLSGFGLYAQTAGGGLGAKVAASPKQLFCITHDAFIGDVPNTPANPSPLYDPSHCTDPNGVLGMSVGWADQYDQTDPGQSIDISGLADGTYILRAVADPLHLTVESDRTDNVTDTVIRIAGTSVTVLGQSTPTVVPPSAAMTSPAAGAAVSGTVPLSVSTSGPAAIASVQYLLDGYPLGAAVTTAPFDSTWTVGSVAPGRHWLSAQVTDTNGNIGTAPQDVVDVAQHVGSMVIENQVTQNGTTTVTTPSFSTSGTNELLVATVASDNATPGQTAVVSGGGLAWSRIARANQQAGDAEIWTAIAPAHLNGATITATAGTPGFDLSLTVMAILGAGAIGATNTAAAASGAPSVSFTSTGAGTFGIAVGEDPSSATARVLGSGQALVSQWIDGAGGDTFWTQDTSAATTSSGQNVVLRDSSPTSDVWNLAAVEVVPTGSAPPDTQPPSVDITTPTGGQTLSGSVPVTATAMDNVAIVTVQLLLDGAPLGPPVTSSPFSITWDTTTATNGTHTISAEATDTSGNTATAATVSVTVQNPPPEMVCFLQDVNITASGLGNVTTASFHTGLAGELLLAFAAADGPSSGGQTLGVSGAGLTWTLVKRANAQAGDAEIWAATATGVVTNGVVTSTESIAGYDQSLNVVALQGTNGTGASAATGASTGAPTISVTTTHDHSLVFGVGNDWDNATARTVGPNQSIESQYLSPSGDTFWTQYTTVQSGAAGSIVTLNDTAPTTDRYNFAAVEIIGAAS
jgi:Big-like domain-containing protein/fibronectin type III domain protein/lysyl oxidase